MKISDLSGKVFLPDMLVNVPALITAYYTGIPDPTLVNQRISFGTSGHRGSALKNSFNENHILALSQAICLYRKQMKIDGPLYLGIDTHALSTPAFASTLEVLAANGVEVMIADGSKYTPTPVISHAILTYNKGRENGFADGIIITPSHNPPTDGGFKYNPPDGGPAGTSITKWIENKANEILQNNLKEVKRIPFERAVKVSTTHKHDFITLYVNDLKNVIDMDAISASGIHIGVDPLGGAGVHYWEPIAEKYKLNMNIVNKYVDPAFGFMTADWDGQIRMDPSSPYAMHSLIKMKDRFDISIACDTDHDRHGIVTPSEGLISPNHYLAVSISYLLNHRKDWKQSAAIGKTLVSSVMIDRVTEDAGRKLFEVPVGFKWFVEGLLDSSLCFVGEESAGATFSKKDGSVWTTDKDGLIPGLLAAEIIANTGLDPSEHYKVLTSKFGESVYDRVEASATLEQKAKLSKLSPSEVTFSELAGDKIIEILTTAPGNNEPIGGLKVVTENGWFAARPSGTEMIYKIYGESFHGREHLKRIFEEAQEIVNASLSKGVAEINN